MRKLFSMKRVISAVVALAMMLPVFPSALAVEDSADTSESVLKLGDYIQMGTYGGEPIKWRVMAFEKVKGTKEDGTPVIDSTQTVSEYTEGYLPLLVADSIITMKAFDAGCDQEETPLDTSSHSRFAYGDPVRSNGSNYWGDSNIRCWLNSSAEGGEVDWTCGFAPEETFMYPNDNGYADEEGFLNSFAPTELNAIVSVSQKTLIDAPHDGDVDETSYDPVSMPETVDSANKNYALYQSEYNTDTIFLPDIMQVYNIFQNADFLGGSAYFAFPTYYAQQQIPADSRYSAADDELSYYPYWLRTPDDGSGSSACVIMPPNSDAASNEMLSSSVNASDIGVRPACYIDMTALDMTSSDGTEYSPYTVDLPEYTVTYNASKNGGKIQEDSTYSESVCEGTDIIPGNDNIGEKDGYEFIGWNTDPNAKEGLISYKVTGDVTLYAIYAKDTDVVAYFHNLDSSAEKSEPVKIYNNDTVGTLIFPDEYDTDEWTFEGWTSDKDSSEVEYRANDEAYISEDTNYYAVYSREVTMTYVLEATTSEGSWTETYTQSMNTQYQTSTMTVTLPAAPQKADYSFEGWVMAGDNNNTLYHAGDKVTVNTDTTFYAKFKKTVSVRFYSRNGMIQKTTLVEVSADVDSVSVELPAISLYAGWTAVGWSNDGTAAAPNIQSPDGGETTISTGADAYFYAVYSRDITLSYDENAAASETETQYFNSAGNTSEIEFTLADAPTNTSDTFVAWAIGSKDGEKHKQGETIKVSEDTTVYAVWQSDNITNYTVTYDYQTNGGTYLAATADKVSVNSGDKADLTVTAYKETYDFVGWNTDKNATEALTQYTVTEDVTLYAIYKKTVMAQFMEEANKPQSVEYAVLYNNADSAIVTAPEPVAKDGWTADGWRSDEDAAPAAYKSGTIKISNDTYFYPVYKRFITLSYDVNGGNGTISPDTALQYMNGYGNVQAVTFTLAAPPQRSGHSFSSWIVSADSTRGYQGGETVTLTENATATASWSEIPLPAERVSVTYDYAANGGTRTTKAYDTLEAGAKADLTPVAVKANYEFVGWNIDKNAETALTEYTVTKDTTLYAIYKRDITANFYSGENTLQDTISKTLFNNESKAVITAPEPAELDGWTAVGWRDNKHALENEYKSGDITISEDTDFYAIYSRDITVCETTTEGENVNTVSFSQYRNAAGGMESKTVMLEEPAPREGYRFRGWAVGDETGKRYKPGTAVSVSESTNLVGLWVELPKGDVNLPTVQTGAASVSSSTSATISAKVEDNGGNEVIEQGFVYWSKLNSESKYTVLTSDDEPCTLSNLSPDTEYYYY
ncbi:MAG: InlB B-repeat-containing protein, partial [Hominilimicola sp.]